MGSDTTLQIDDDGLPLFQRNPACAVVEGIDVATALELSCFGPYAIGSGEVSNPLRGGDPP